MESNVPLVPANVIGSLNKEQYSIPMTTLSITESSDPEIFTGGI